MLVDGSQLLDTAFTGIQETGCSHRPIKAFNHRVPDTRIALTTIVMIPIGPAARTMLSGQPSDNERNCFVGRSPKSTRMKPRSEKRLFAKLSTSETDVPFFDAILEDLGCCERRDGSRDHSIIVAREAVRPSLSKNAPRFLCVSPWRALEVHLSTGVSCPCNV